MGYSIINQLMFIIFGNLGGRLHDVVLDLLVVITYYKIKIKHEALVF